MAAPITWRNVDVNPVGEISRALMSSQLALNAGFDNFSNVLKSVESTDAANWNQQKTNNTNEFLNTIAQYRTPEEYQAAVAAGTLQNMLASRGAQIDQQVARTTMGAQLGKLQEQVTANQKFEQEQLEHKQAPIRNQVLGDIYLGRIQSGLDAARDNNLTNFASIAKTAAEVEQRKATQEREAKKFGWEETNQGLNQRKTSAEITALERDAADAKELRSAEGVANRFATEYKQATEKARSGIASVLAVDPAYAKFVNKGSVAVEDMTSNEVTAANALLKSKGLPELSVFKSGDSDAAKNIEQKLTEQGFSPRSIAETLKLVPSMVNTAPVAPIGIDAVTSAYDKATKEALAKEAEDRYGTVATPGHITDLRKTIDEYVNTLENTSTFGMNTRENITKAANDWIQTKGIEGPDGLRLLPSADQMASILRTIDRSWLRSDETDVYNALDAWAKRSKKGASEVSRNKAAKAERELKAKLYPEGK